MTSTTRYVIGIDAGGTHTRVACAALDGTVLISVRGSGGSPTHNADAETTVPATVLAALAQAGLPISDATAVVMGIAGLNRDEDRAWARSYLDLPGLDCPVQVVNDAVTAHVGAFGGGPGVIVVAGTGSMIMAIDRDGTTVESGVYRHYAGGARHLVWDLFAHLLTGHATHADDDLVTQILGAWGVADLPALRRAAFALDEADRHDAKRRYGDLAPLITAAAGWSPLAAAALGRLTSKTALGVALVAPHASREPVVPVATAGSLATQPAFLAILRTELDLIPTIDAALVEPQLGPVGGALALALRSADQVVDPSTVDRLRDAD